MSAFGKQGYRCDTCGKFTKAKNREYTSPDKSAGYIWPEDNEDPNSRDICEECIEAQDKKLSINGS